MSQGLRLDYVFFKITENLLRRINFFFEEYGSFFESYLVKNFNSLRREKNHRKILNLDMILKLEHVHVC